MPVGVDTPAVSFFLRTFGAPALVRVQDERSTVDMVQLRRKDLALLVFLCAEERRPHSRGLLASMLWGDTSEERARHSLAQALSRLRAILGPGALLSSAESVSWRGPLRSDVALLDLELDEGALAKWPRAPFLADFMVGHGSAEFEIWAEQKRSYYRLLLLQRLERLGGEAERAGAWADALACGQQAVEVDAIAEEGHRRVMRAWSAMGERGLALQHFRSFKRWLGSELEAEPDALTCALAEELSTTSCDGQIGRSVAANWVASTTRGHGAGWSRSHTVTTATRIYARRDSPSRRRPRRRAGVALSVMIGTGLLVFTPLAPTWLDADELTIPPGDGQPVLVAGEELPLLAFAGSFLRYPDLPTFLACSGSQAGAVMHEFTLPRESAEGTLPSVLRYPALAGVGLVRSERDPQHVYAIVGCVKSAVPEFSLARRSQSGPIHPLPDSILDALPTGSPLLTPVRAPGTVIRARGRSELRWILFGGGALSVPTRGILASHCSNDVLEVGDSEFYAYKVVGRLNSGAGACGIDPRAPPKM